MNTSSIHQSICLLYTYPFLSLYGILFYIFQWLILYGFTIQQAVIHLRWYVAVCNEMMCENVAIRIALFATYTWFHLLEIQVPTVD